MLPQIGRPTPAVGEPNDLWTVDFKGWWYALDGAKCEPLTVRDAYSRFVLAIRLQPDTGTSSVMAVFTALFEEQGVPRAIQSDNGPPFASTTTIGGLTKLSAWWVSLGIELVRSRPGCPQDNGGHERMHADIEREIRAKVARTRALQQKACDEWRVEFNHVRPHEALGMKTPSEIYRPSPRRPVVQTGAFPSGCERRIVNPRGWIAWNRQRIYVTTALVGHTVGLVQLRDEVFVWFYQMLLGTFRCGQGLESVEPIKARAVLAELPPGNTGSITR